MFYLDQRIESTCFTLGEWALSRVLLKNERAFPWFILVPRKNNVQEIHQLKKLERIMLMEEINQLSLLIKNYFNPYKLNIGALGNVVSQLHIHVVGRNQSDILWPQGIWQASMETGTYSENQLKTLIPDLKKIINGVDASMKGVAEASTH